MPFTREQFFEVFAAYNAAVWPAQVALNLLALAAVTLVIFAPRRAGRAVAVMLALLWAWPALAYHLAFFERINPAAPAFAILSMAGALLFLVGGALQGRLRFEPRFSGRVAAGLGMAIFALALYPVLGFLAGHRYPATPTFGLPCPVTLFTFGLLLMAAPNFPKALAAVPLAWALVGTAGAFLLGVPQDYSLLAAAAAGIYLLGQKRYAQ